MLHNIVDTKKREVERLKATTTEQELISLCQTAPTLMGFRSALVNSSRQVSVIAEVKKASPSKGLIRPDFDPLAIAESYEQANVEAISVLTDQKYFQGHAEYLSQIRQQVQLPILRKDFLIDELQILESRSMGADCILLIAAILDSFQLQHFSQVAKELGMDVLLEVHDAVELETALTHARPSLLGINNRNLRTFVTSLQTTEELIKMVPSDIPVVSESGIATKEDIAYLYNLGARAVLVGEHFMRQSSVEKAVVDLVGERVVRI